MDLYETHIPVADTRISEAFYQIIVGLSPAHRDPKRDVAFLWIGANRSSMLGLWGPSTTHGSHFRTCHFAIRLTLPELLASGKRLVASGITCENFMGEKTVEPSVIGWMPSAQLYFRDPDGHSLEFISLLDEQPAPGFIGSFSAWQKRDVDKNQKSIDELPASQPERERFNDPAVSDKASTDGQATPKISSVLETALYVADLDRSVAFYKRVLGLSLASEPISRMCALNVTESQVLLLFKKGASVRATVTPYGTIPPTDGDGSLHVAFFIPASDFESWRGRLHQSRVDIESIVMWPVGGRSIYFRDPDNHLIELKTSYWSGSELAA
jgi:lactoylglutathione lyase